MKIVEKCNNSENRTHRFIFSRNVGIASILHSVDVPSSNGRKINSSSLFILRSVPVNKFLIKF